MSQAFAALWAVDGFVAAVVAGVEVNRSIACKQIGILVLALPTAEAMVISQHQHSNGRK